jgi:hypothetical protein
MRSRVPRGLGLWLLLLALALPAWADMRVLKASVWQQMILRALARQDWQGVIDHMARAGARRPGHDSAYTVLGFTYRQLGDYRSRLPLSRLGMWAILHDPGTTGLDHKAPGRDNIRACSYLHMIIAG